MNVTVRGLSRQPCKQPCFSSSSRTQVKETELSGVLYRHQVDWLRHFAFLYKYDIVTKEYGGLGFYFIYPEENEDVGYSSLYNTGTQTQTAHRRHHKVITSVHCGCKVKQAMGN